MLVSIHRQLRSTPLGLFHTGRGSVKFFPAQLSYLTEGQSARRNLSVLGRFIVVLAAMITVYSITFHLIDRDVALSPGQRLDLPPHTRHGATVGPDGVECWEAAQR